MKKRIVIVLHQETSTPGRVGMKLTQKGYELDIRRPALGDVLPDNIEDYSGAVIFGGPMSANDDSEHEYIRTEIDWIAKPLASGVPFLGICLGGQMLARQLGGKVFGFPDERAEIGYYGISATAEGTAYGPWPQKVYQWHREGFELVDGAVSLATSKGDFPHQAFQYGDSAFAIQFHPEVTHKMMNRWLVKAEERLALPGARPRDSHFSDRFVHDPAVDVWLDRFLDDWLATAQTPVSVLAAE
ncbi:MAG: glutamine amidotransferase [Anderseniella sp.]|nr:glutamine amidotransferase [Anderseniella sp.]